MSDDKLWQFPCEFPLKVFGKIDSGFESFALTTIRKHVAELSENCVESRPSKNGAYIALTVIFTATSKEQLDAIYSELSASELILMVL